MFTEKQIKEAHKQKETEKRWEAESCTFEWMGAPIVVSREFWDTNVEELLELGCKLKERL
jgi:hypothetical protein